MKRIIVSALLVLGVASSFLTVQPASAIIIHQDKVTICHRTNSVTNPYVKIKVDQSAVDGVAGNSKSQPDHYGEHQGPVATSESVAQALKDDKTKWGDIIPPVTGYHSGLNWTTEGQKIYDNNCNYVDEDSEPVVATASVTIVPATCESGEKLVYGPIEYATFSGTADGTVGPGAYSVTATAGEGAVFNDGDMSSDTLVLEGTLGDKLTGDDCVLGEDAVTPTVLPNTSGTGTGLALLSVVGAALTATGFGIRRLLTKEI